VSTRPDPADLGSTDPASTGPLAGLVVVEMGGFIAGPFAGQLLGDYGARVIKIEPPGGDPMRTWGITAGGESLWWPTLGRNKESVVLDLREPAARQAARDLCLAADAVIENFAPGRLAAWGLDYATLSADRPALVMTHVSGFGQDGPRSGDRGFGSVAEAMGGLRHVSGYPDRPSVRPGISIGDSLAALFAVIGTLAALRAREVTGRGQEVDVALYESVFAVMESTVADWAVGGVERTRAGSALPGVAPSNVYATADGQEMLIAANSDPIFRRLAAAMGQPGLADDPRFADHARRGAAAAELDALVGAWAATLTATELETVLDRHQVPRGRSYAARDMLADLHYRAREMIVTSTAGGQPLPVPAAGVVPKFSRTPGTIRHPGPPLGAHNGAVTGPARARPN
jgi:formyl-CoA transferase